MADPGSGASAGKASASLPMRAPSCSCACAVMSRLGRPRPGTHVPFIGTPCRSPAASKVLGDQCGVLIVLVDDGGRVADAVARDPI